MLSGIINLKKEAGMTSHDAVFKLRKILKEKKIGHGGTLDPDVTGVLPIAVLPDTRSRLVQAMGLVVSQVVDHGLLRQVNDRQVGVSRQRLRGF